MLLATLVACCSCTEEIVIAAGEYPAGGNVTPPVEEIGNIVRIKALGNPDRGLHLESNYFVHNYINPFNNSEVYPNGFIDQRLQTFKAGEDELHLTQLYLYLTEYVNKDIPQEGFDKMQVIFDALKAKGYKAILRFAYNYTGLNTSGGETMEGIKHHLEQLKPFLRKNLGQISAMQTGFIGAWGEWHNSPLSNNQAAKNMLLDGLLDILPEGYCVEIRTPDHKNALTLSNPANLKRIGFNNDYFTAGEHSHAPGNDFVPGDTWYQQAVKESPYFFMSGEIPYAENTEWGLHTLISVDKTLQILRDHHYSAFDITQNFEVNINNWKFYKVYPSLLTSLKVLYSEDYFKDENGKIVARSAYDFIRDHLGYRLNLLPATTFKADGGNLTYSIQFTNTGFATVVNPKPVYLVFVGNDGNVAKEIKLDVNPRDWQPFDPATVSYEVLTHKMEGTINPGLSGTYKVGIWMPDNHDDLKHNNLYDVRWAESESLKHWKSSDGKYTVNILGEVTF